MLTEYKVDAKKTLNRLKQKYLLHSEKGHRNLCVKRYSAVT